MCRHMESAQRAKSAHSPLMPNNSRWSGNTLWSGRNQGRTGISIRTSGTPTNELGSSATLRPCDERPAMTILPSIETLKAVLDAFNAHDLDRIMAFFSDDCVLEMPR